MTNDDTNDLEIVNLDTLKAKRFESPGNPWKVARKLKQEKAAEFLTPEDIYNKLDKFDNIRDKCLFVILYITAARIEEVVRRKVIRWGKKNVRLINHGKSKNASIQDYTKKRILREEPGMVRSDITIEKFGDRKVLLFRIRNLKNKQKDSTTKLIPFPLDTEINKKFARVITLYYPTLYADEELFPIGSRRAEQIIAKAGFNPHFIRSCRLTHLVRYHNFSDQKLKAFAGWTDSRPAKHYIKIRWEDLVNSM